LRSSSAEGVRSEEGTGGGGTVGMYPCICGHMKRKPSIRETRTQDCLWTKREKLRVQEDIYPP